MNDFPTVSAEQFLASPKQKVFDRLEVFLATQCGPLVDMQVTHRFTPGLYIREILMRAGTTCTSKIHKFEHPFVISQGRCSVWTEEAGWVDYKAPFTGITKPMTRRLLVIHEDTIWTTFHVTNKTSLEEIEAELLVSHNERDGLSEEDIAMIRKFQHFSDDGLPKLEDKL